MPRKLKTYITSLGFFELAIAAPSMKAALEAWGSQRNLFHEGFASETDDPAIVAATMAKPGIILKRAVGSKGAFQERADLPTSLPADKPKRVLKPQAKKRATISRHTTSTKIVDLAGARAAKQAAAAFEKERIKREAASQKEAAVAERLRARRDAASAKAEAALERARQGHDEAVRNIESEREALDRRLAAEDARWKKTKDKLEHDVRRAKE